MKVEFILKDKDGIELNEGDNVNWRCENNQAAHCMGDYMWNSGEIIPGKLLFFRTKEQVSSEYQKTEAYKGDRPKSYHPSNVAGLELMFMSKKGYPIWSIRCPSEADNFRHLNLEKTTKD